MRGVSSLGPKDKEMFNCKLNVKKIVLILFLIYFLYRKRKKNENNFPVVFSSQDCKVSVIR